MSRLRSRNTSGSGLFLLELMIAILFFAVAAVVCVQVFVQAHQMSTEAGELLTAQSLAADLAEQIEEIPAGEQVWYFDADGASCRELKAAYLVTAEISEEQAASAKGVLRTMDLTVSRAENGEEIYSLTAERYMH